MFESLTALVFRPCFYVCDGVRSAADYIIHDGRVSLMLTLLTLLILTLLGPSLLLMA